MQNVKYAKQKQNNWQQHLTKRKKESINTKGKHKSYAINYLLSYN